MTDPAGSVRKLLWLAAHTEMAEEARLAKARAIELAKKHRIDLASLSALPASINASPRRYDWLNGKWIDQEKW